MCIRINITNVKILAKKMQVSFCYIVKRPLYFAGLRIKCQIKKRRKMKIGKAKKQRRGIKG